MVALLIAVRFGDSGIIVAVSATATPSQPNTEHPIPPIYATSMLYSQPDGAIDLRASVFPNPTSHGAWPRFVNTTSIVFWQRDAGAALAVDTPTAADLDAHTRLGPVTPDQQAVAAGGEAAQGAQYAHGVLGLYLNTSGAPEKAHGGLTTETIESTWMQGRTGCVAAWADGGGVEVSLDLAAPTAARCARGAGAPCAIYSSLSLNVHSVDFKHYMWWETSLFDFQRPVLKDKILFDESSQQPIVHGFAAKGTGGDGPVSRYNDAVAGSLPAFNDSRAAAQRLAWRVAGRHVERAVADVKKRFGAGAAGLPGAASDWCIGGFNIELEATPNCSAGIRISNLTIALSSAAATPPKIQIPAAAQRYVDALGLARTPFGNYFADFYASRYNDTALPSSRFPGGTRVLASSIYNLFASDAAHPNGTQQRGFPLHRLTQDEIWNYYDGDGPVTLYLFDFETARVRTVVVGRLADRGVPQFVVPGGAYVGALLASSATWCVTGAQTVPGWDPRDTAMVAGNATLLAEFNARFPHEQALIERLTAF